MRRAGKNVMYALTNLSVHLGLYENTDVYYASFQYSNITRCKTFDVVRYICVPLFDFLK